MRKNGQLEEQEEVTGAESGSIPKRHKTDSGENGGETIGRTVW
jgi:hypothetical protein